MYHLNKYIYREFVQPPLAQIYKVWVCLKKRWNVVQSASNLDIPRLEGYFSKSGTNEKVVQERNIYVRKDRL